MGNPLKSEIRAGAVHEVGVRLDDLLERARYQVAEAKGKNAGAQVVQQRLVALAANVDVDVTEGRYDLTTASIVKQYLMRAQTVAELTAKEAADEHQRALGAMAAASTAVEITKKLYEAEKSSARVAEEVPVADAAPVSPKSIKQRRLEEAPPEEDRRVENA